HGVVDDLADRRLLGAVLEVGPASGGRDPEDVFSAVFVGIFGIRAGVIPYPGNEFGVMLFEAVGDVLEEDETENDVLVLGGVHVAAQLIGCEPELGFEA